MTKVTVVFHRDENKIPKRVDIQRGRKKLKVYYEYSPDKDVYSYTLEGRRNILPSFGEILEIIDAMRASESRKVVPIEGKVLVREKGAESRIYHRGGSLASNTEDTICDLPNKDIELQHLEFSTNYSTNRLYVFPYKADGTVDEAILVMGREGLNWKTATPFDINTHKSIVWLELIYDETNDYYKFGLAYSIRFANGIKIVVKNVHATEARNINCEVVVMIRG